MDPAPRIGRRAAGPHPCRSGGDGHVLDNSPKQLERDARAAEQYRLPITTIRGDMANPGMLADASLDLVVHPEIAAGFAITGMYEDTDTSADGYALNQFMSTFIATRGVKPVHA